MSNLFFDAEYQPNPTGERVQFIEKLTQGPAGPRGSQGPAGQDGADGMNGADGMDGADGDSAYQVWLTQGNSGSEQDFLDYLKGSQGDAGPAGQDGSDGMNGADGSNGIDGMNGTDGANGADGADGADGSSGVSIESRDVANLIANETDGTTAYCKDAKGFGLYPNNHSQDSMVYKKGNTYYTYDGSVEVVPSGPSLWKVGSIFNDFNPDTGAFNATEISSETTNGIYKWIGRIDCNVGTKYIQIAVTYTIKDSLRSSSGTVPAVLGIHGWYGGHNNAGTTFASTELAGNDYALMTLDYRGEDTSTGTDANRTIYPSGDGFNSGGDLDMASMNESNTATIDSVRTKDYYYWQAMTRRVLSFLRSKTEVDNNNIGVIGMSVGGTLSTCLTSEPRVKAVVAYYGAGWCEFNARKANWDEADNWYISSISPNAHFRSADTPYLYLNGTNDNHGIMPYVLEGLKYFPTTTPVSWSLEPNVPHSNHPNTNQNVLLWLNKYLKGTATTWYSPPTLVEGLVSTGQANAGYPMVTVTPDADADVSSVEVWFFHGNTYPHQGNTLTWTQANVVNNNDGTYSAELPTINVNDNAQAYAQITYHNTIVVASHIKTFLPTDLGNAVSTDPLFNPSTLSNMVLRLDASGLTSTDATWTDDSPAGNNATRNGSVQEWNTGTSVYNTITPNAAYTENSPTVVLNAQNSLPVMRYTNHTWHSWNTVEDARTIFIVSKRTGTGGYHPILGYHWTNTKFNRYDWHSSGTNLVDIFSPAHNQTWRYNGTGVTPSTTNHTQSMAIIAIQSTTDLLASSFAIDRFFTQRAWIGDLAELMIFNTTLGTSDIEKVEGYLTHKWGLTGNLPSNHPYKNIHPIA